MNPSNKNQQASKPLCRLIATSERWTNLKDEIYSNIIDPAGFQEVRRALSLIEELGQDGEAPKETVRRVRGKEPQEVTQTQVPSESGVDPDLEEK